MDEDSLVCKGRSHKGGEGKGSDLRVAISRSREEHLGDSGRKGGYGVARGVGVVLLLCRAGVCFFSGFGLRS